MVSRQIQLKHSNGPISIIIDYLPEMEQLYMQQVNKNFYNKVVPGSMKKISFPKTYLFAAS